MSKFADKLQRIYKGTAPAMGFKKSDEAESPPLLFVASLAKTGAAEAYSLAMAGIDAGILGTKGLSGKSFAEMTKAVGGGVSLGCSLEAVEKDAAAKSIGLGCDFVIFGLKTPLETVNKEGIGRVLKIEPSLEPGLVRAINTLPVEIDGVLVAGDEPVTIERLLIYQRFTELLNKPLLVNVSSNVTLQELSGLVEAGVTGVVLPETFSAEALAGLKQSAAGLSRGNRRKTKTAAILPRVSGELETEVEEEEEE